MGKKDARIDAYIAKSADFAKPILNHIRRVVHAGCPEVEEALKWGMPSFIHHGILCNMAAFRGHCALAFWKRKLLFGKGGSAAKKDGMGNFGRITALSDLPGEKVLIAYVKAAAKLNEEGVKVPDRTKPKKALVIPATLVTALQKNKRAWTTFESFPPSHKREYVEWITEAKREETRSKRLETAIAWMAKGKPRNWKYMNC